MSNLGLKFTIADDGTVTIEGTPESLAFLGEQLLFKSRHPESVFVSIVGHGPPKVKIDVPGIECPPWLKIPG